MSKSKFALTLKKLRVNANLTQKQMAELFDKDRRTITRHIQNIYKEKKALLQTTNIGPLAPS